ncbi:hypothetical protein AB1N83_001922 [Pleurotus pulmonarius]
MAAIANRGAKRGTAQSFDSTIPRRGLSTALERTIKVQVASISQNFPSLFFSLSVEAEKRTTLLWLQFSSLTGPKAVSMPTSREFAVLVPGFSQLNNCCRLHSASRVGQLNKKTSQNNLTRLYHRFHVMYYKFQQKQMFAKS